MRLARGLKGDPEPLTSASYRMFGLHPDKVYGAILARRQAKLGREYSQWFDPAGNLKPEWLDIPDYDPTSGIICSVPLGKPRSTAEGWSQSFVSTTASED